VKGTLGKKCIKICKLGLKPFITKAYPAYWPISELSLELSAVYVSQVNKPHTVIFQNQF